VRRLDDLDDHTPVRLQSLLVEGVVHLELAVHKLFPLEEGAGFETAAFA
jgi:hypothetical protein